MLNTATSKLSQIREKKKDLLDEWKEREKIYIEKNVVNNSTLSYLYVQLSSIEKGLKFLLIEEMDCLTTVLKEIVQEYEKTTSKRLVLSEIMKAPDSENKYIIQLESEHALLMLHKDELEKNLQYLSCKENRIRQQQAIISTSDLNSPNETDLKLISLTAKKEKVKIKLDKVIKDLIIPKQRIYELQKEINTQSKLELRKIDDKLDKLKQLHKTVIKSLSLLREEEKNISFALNSGSILDKISTELETIKSIIQKNALLAEDTQKLQATTQLLANSNSGKNENETTNSHQKFFEDAAGTLIRFSGFKILQQGIEMIQALDSPTPKKSAPAKKEQPKEVKTNTNKSVNYKNNRSSTLFKVTSSKDDVELKETSSSSKDNSDTVLVLPQKDAEGGFELTEFSLTSNPNRLK